MPAACQLSDCLSSDALKKVIAQCSSGNKMEVAYSWAPRASLTAGSSYSGTRQPAHQQPRVVVQTHGWTVKQSTLSWKNSVGSEINQRAPVSSGVARQRRVRVQAFFGGSKRQSAAGESAFALKGAANIKLPSGTTVIGRDRDDADFVINKAAVSSAHVSLTVGPRGVQVKDLGSTNGTFVNGKQIRSASLKAGDTLTLGNVNLTLTEKPAPKPKEAPAARGGSQRGSQIFGTQRGSGSARPAGTQRRGTIFGGSRRSAEDDDPAAARRAAAEAKKQAQAEARAEKQAQAEAKKQAQAEARAQKQAEAEERKRAQAEAQAEARAAKQAQAEAKKQAQAEARAQKQAQNDAKAEKQAQAEAKKQAQAEARAQKQAEAEARKQAQAEARAEKQAQAEAKKQAQAEARAQKQAEAEERKRAQADARSREQAQGAQQAAKEQAAEERRRAQEEARAEKQAQAEAKKQAQAEARAAKQAAVEERKQAQAEARAAKQAEAEERKQAQAEARAARQAEVEAKRQAKASAAEESGAPRGGFFGTIRSSARKAAPSGSQRSGTIISRGDASQDSTFVFKQGRQTIRLSSGAQVLGRDSDDCDIVIRGQVGGLHMTDPLWHRMLLLLR
ncbi:hypothetical protein CYMTET_19368 [Cymbomonas tetramitiformis]|uniref:FHA domain-containing protein n=1 Tax=Cymbomonas tetramitiformis TaxID=36881 RepID=A0AAE0G699_9CHLO|nr:hypothetical protein CYMTET_19368 [Cymbomonas tetramitiformis]